MTVLDVYVTVLSTEFSWYTETRAGELNGPRIQTLRAEGAG